MNSSSVTTDGEEGGVETSEEGNPALELSTSSASKKLYCLLNANNANLKKLLSFEKQMLQVARDVIAFKKHILQEMKYANTSHVAQINILTYSLVVLTNAHTAALHRPVNVAHSQLQLFQCPMQG